MKLIIVGSGVVGEATGTVFKEHGFDVTFTDVSADVVKRLRDKGHQAFTIEEVSEPRADAFIVSVPTYPYDLCKNQAHEAQLEQEMSPYEWCDVGINFIKSASEVLGRWLKGASGYSVVVMRSAVLPGTTEDVVIPTIEDISGKKAGTDFGVAVVPEYLRERTSIQDIRKPWVVVLGANDDKTGNICDALYSWADCPIFHTSVKEAEMQKFIHNLCNAAKISYFNEMRLICERIKVDADKIMPIVAKSAEALWNPEYGTKNYGAFGGKCLPKDTLAFVEWARRGGLEARMIKASIDVNEEYKQVHPDAAR